MIHIKWSLKTLEKSKVLRKNKKIKNKNRKIKYLDAYDEINEDQKNKSKWQNEKKIKK